MYRNNKQNNRHEQIKWSFSIYYVQKFSNLTQILIPIVAVSYILNQNVHTFPLYIKIFTFPGILDKTLEALIF